MLYNYYYGKSGKKFTPASYSGLKVWLDASDLGSITSIATFTFNTSNSATMTIQCKQNIMPTSIVAQEGPPTTLVLSGGVLTATDPAMNDIDRLAAFINSQSAGYTATVLTFGTDTVVSGTTGTPGSQTVVTWADKSGNGNNATLLTGANRPTTGADTMNGRNVITFGGNASSQGLMINGISIKPNTLGGVFKGVSAVWDDWDGIICTRTSLSTKVSNSTHQSGMQGVDAVGKICGMGQVTTSAYVNGSAVTSTDFDNYLVGVNLSPGGTPAPHVVIYTDDFGSNGTQNYCIGTDTFGALGVRHLLGKIAEIWIYDNALSATQILRLSRYAKQKWATG